MTSPARGPGLSARDLQRILDVTNALAAPFDLRTMLDEVVDAAKQVLDAERGSVWLHDPATDELVLEVATSLQPVRIPSGVGLVGTCARTRQIINVTDCYADPRFDPGVDKASGYRTRCMLTLPLVDHRNVLVGVMQVLNKSGDVFDADDERLATALAAQCAVALQRVRMTESLIEGEKMRQALEMARVVQMSTLPTTMPAVPGYEVCGSFEPADLTGGDTFDLSMIDAGLLVVLGDATGHGIAPALSVTQMHAMLRMAFRLSADLDDAFVHVNNRLCETLPSDRFITAFIGILDPATHRMRFHSGGQGPILLYQAATATFQRFKPTSFPMGAMPLASLRPAVTLALEPGDLLVLVSDGIYEYRDAHGATFGEEPVRDLVRAHRDKPVAELMARLVKEVRSFADGAPQEDDMTVVLVRRQGQAIDEHAFNRSIASLPAIFTFTRDVFARRGLDAGLLRQVDLVIEELFTNMVKYSTMSDAAVRIGIAAGEGGVQVTLTDFDVDPFDITRAPDADIALPVHARLPGGLGLHLVRRLVDSVQYEYVQESRQSRITFRMAGAPGGGSPDAGQIGGSDAGD